MAHNDGHAGNDALLLITSGGGTNHETEGEMRPTEWLNYFPAVQTVMDGLPCDIERSRFMRLRPGYVMPRHTDYARYWANRVRIHIPIRTNDLVEFWCDGETRNMVEGSCWIFDNTKKHGVYNGGNEPRIHLVMDSLGSLELFDAAV